MEQKHSGRGIASFITSVVSGLMLLVFFAATRGGVEGGSEEAKMVVFALLAFFITSLIGLGLGIAGLFQIKRKKVFAILGTVISIAVIVGMTSMIMWGLSIE